MNKRLLATIGLAVIGGAVVMFWQASAPEDDLMTPTVSTRMHGADAAAPARPADEIVVPKLSSAGAMGKANFEEKCASCHGVNAAGTKKKGHPWCTRSTSPRTMPIFRS